ncbi:MAG TPA: alpha/beta hydrolase [Polyangiaceae bacterium]|nr:alpha/beta hydrolase [Polyangiaceae bacterium]
MERLRIRDTGIRVALPRGAARVGSSSVLLLHGAGASHRQWGPFIEALAPGFVPIAVDLPGHGESDGTVAPSLDAAVEFLAELFEALRLPTPLWCIGHSAGGVLALSLALHYPKRLSGLCTIASAPRLQLHPDFVQQARHGRFEYELARGGFARSDDPWAELVYDDLCKVRFGPASMFDGEHLDVRAALPNLRVPLLAIGAGSDRIVSPRHSRSLAAGVPRGTCVTLNDAGHYVHLEQPRQAAREFHDWAERLQREQGA